MASQVAVKSSSKAVIADALDRYISLKEKMDKAEAACEVAKEELKKALGEIQETTVNGIRILFKPNVEIDQKSLKTELPDVYQACLQKFDTAFFRASYPQLVDVYEKESKVRPLKLMV